MCWPNVDVLVLSKMDPPQEAVNETTESVNPLYQSASSPSDSTTNEYASTEALVRISQDMHYKKFTVYRQKLPTD